MNRQYENSNLGIAVLPIVCLALLLGGALYLFGDDTTSGPAQIALISAGLIAAIIGFTRGIAWKELEKGVSQTVERALPAIYILLAVGALIGVWIQAGIVPSLIYYGLQIIAPEIFYVAALLACAVAAVSIGSSWTTAGTVGLTFVSIAQAAGLSVEMTAGAVISGAYFGDKLSPLSDTTNLAAAVTGTDLFEHIRYMLWTTIPAVLFAIACFSYLSVVGATEIDVERVMVMSDALDAQFTISPLLVIPLFVVLGLAVWRKPPFVTIIIGTIVGGVFGLIFQYGAMVAQGGETGFPSAIKAFWSASAGGFTLESGNEDLDKLLSRGGMESMLNTVWLILSALFFGGMMERSGALAALVRAILTGVKTGGALMQRAGLTSLVANIVTPDQFLAIVVPSRMYAQSFDEAGLANRNLSRVLEDYGTVTSPLVPWNTCGAFMAGTLGVATFAYLPFAFFNLASPILSFLYAQFGFKVDAKDDDPEAELEVQTS